MGDQNIRPDGTVAFLPHRLNRYPVVVRGLTADELWVCVGLSAGAGLVLGIPLAIALSTPAMLPTVIVLAVAIGVFVTGGALRRLKRGRPDTWLYRQLQWRLSIRYPVIAPLIGGNTLIVRSGYWSTRRSNAL